MVSKLDAGSQMAFRTIEQEGVSFQHRRVPRLVYRIVIDRLLRSQRHIRAQQNWNSETYMFQSNNGLASANKRHSRNGSSAPLLLDPLCRKAACRSVPLTYLHPLAWYLEAAKERNLAARREVTR